MLNSANQSTKRLGPLGKSGPWLATPGSSGRMEALRAQPSGEKRSPGCCCQLRPPSAVRDTFTPAMDKYISENIHGDTVPFSSFSYVAAPKRDELDLEGDATATGAHNNTAPLPLIPSVAILFRCCDVLVMTSDQYGFVK